MDGGGGKVGLKLTFNTPPPLTCNVYCDLSHDGVHGIDHRDLVEVLKRKEEHGRPLLSKRLLKRNSYPSHNLVVICSFHSVRHYILHRLFTSIYLFMCIHIFAPSTTLAILSHRRGRGRKENWEK